MKIIYIEIITNEIMKEQYKIFIDFLKKFEVDYIVYSDEHNENKIIIELTIKNNIDLFLKDIGEFLYYYPINILRNKPKLSDYDILEEIKQ